MGCAGKKDRVGSGRDEGGVWRRVCGQSSLLHWPWQLQHGLRSHAWILLFRTLRSRFSGVDLWSVKVGKIVSGPA